VTYTELTEQGLLRHPVFVRIRTDKDPEECLAQEILASPAAGPDLEETMVARNAGGGSRSKKAHEEVSFTNLDKVFWPKQKYTKGDLIQYYRSVSEWMLPYLRDRPVVMTRYPDGIDGTSFFQRNAPDWAPNWIETVGLWSEDSQREIDYFVVNDLDALLYLVNLGTIVFHIWSSRISNLDRPDWCILDLDPQKASFANVITIAKHIHEICDEIELPVFVKTSGSSGLHLLIPLGGQVTHEQSRQLAELLARGVAAELSKIATVVRTPSKRRGRVYLDFLQNGRGQLLVAPFSARAVPEASASAPLRWKEVSGRLTTSRAHTIESLPKRMRRFQEDPMAPVLELEPDLKGALAHLSERLG
jgi:bifunctional non-homologous end joining protein LigD